MQGRIIATLFLSSLFIAVGGDSQGSDTREKPVWTLEFVKVAPDSYATALRRLDDQWMRIREEAKRQGEVLSYERIANAGLITPDHKQTDQVSIVLLTEYKSMAAYNGREKLFASIREHLPSNTPPGLKEPLRVLPFFEISEEHLFLDVPAEGNPQFKLIAKQ